MHKKNHFLLIVFIFLSLFSIAKLYDNSANLDSWQYGEWLINYQNGFVRRGLIGELIYLLSTLFNENIQVAFFIIISIICILFYFLNYYFIKDIKLNFIYWLIIFSPLFYLFFVVVSKVGINREIIFYIYYLLYLIHLSQKKFTLKNNWKFIYLYPILLLIHEGMFFYLPYIIFPLFFVTKKKEFNKIFFQAGILVLFSSFLMFVLYLNRGSETHVEAICQSLGIYAPHKCDWWGPINALGHNLHTGVTGESILFFYVHSEYETYLGYLFYILYSFFPLFIFFKYVNFKNKNYFSSKNFFLISIIFSFIFSLPLFHIAQDWSRWFSIHFHLMTYFIFFIHGRKLIDYEKNLNFFKINIYLLNKKMRKVFFIFLFFYGTLLHHHHFFFEGVKLELTYYKVYKKIKNNY